MHVMNLPSKLGCGMLLVVLFLTKQNKQCPKTIFHQLHLRKYSNLPVPA